VGCLLIRGTLLSPVFVTSLREAAKTLCPERCLSPWKRKAWGAERGFIPDLADAQDTAVPNLHHVLTDAQTDVLIALNDLCEIHDRVDLDPNEPLPGVLADLDRPTAEVLQAAADLYELGLIKGIPVNEVEHPVVVLGLTARGRQELPSG